MVKKRGPCDRIEKVLRKKRRTSLTEDNSKESSSKMDRNIMNDSILSLYRKEAASFRESSLSINNNLISNETEIQANDVKNEQLNNAPSSSKISKKSMKLVEKTRHSAFTIVHPTVTFKDVAGLDEILNRILRACLLLRDPKVFSTLNEKIKSESIFLHGPSGCGKTHVVHAVAGETGLPLLEVSATGLVHGVSGESESRIREIFEEALRIAPCIVFIDRIDAIASKIDSRDSRGMERRMTTQLLTSLDDFKKQDNSLKVVVIAASNKLDSIDPDLLSRFSDEYAVKIPNEKARLMILQVLTKHLKLPPDFDLEWLAHHTPGYVGADLERLVKKAFQLSVDRLYDSYICEHFNGEMCELNANSNDQSNSSPSLNAVASYYKSDLEFPIEEKKLTAFSLETFKEALKGIVPLAKREGFCMVPSVTWEDVGALKDIKEELMEAIIWPIQYRKMYETSLGSIKGILLYGPKGCGKTLLAKAIANECSINFLSVKGPELLNMYLGESERAVRQCFQRARNSAPCVIFFDEMDALCPERTGSNANAAAERVVNMLLTEMDGMEERNEVFVIGATNRLEKIDSAMLRPGRLEKIIYIGLPTPDDRVNILNSLTKDKTKPKISDDVDLAVIGHDSRCNNFSGADLASLIRVAAAHVIKENIKSSSTDDVIEIKWRNFDHAFNVVKPSVTEKDLKYFQRISEQRH